MEYAIGFILGMITMWLLLKLWKCVVDDELLHSFKKDRDALK